VGPGLRQVTGLREHGNEIFGFIKSGKFIE